jgi:hypothetical protein
MQNILVTYITRISKYPNLLSTPLLYSRIFGLKQKSFFYNCRGLVRNYNIFLKTNENEVFCHTAIQRDA